MSTGRAPAGVPQRPKPASSTAGASRRATRRRFAHIERLPGTHRMGGNGGSGRMTHASADRRVGHWKEKRREIDPT
jgi:hypothetical protein